MKKQNIIQPLRHHLQPLALAVTGCVVFALTPAAQAVEVQVYKETFVGTTSGEALTLNTGWSAPNSALVGTATYFTSTAPPDTSDAWFARWYQGTSSCHTYGTTAEYPITAASRIGTKFMVDWARGINNGAKFVAKVGGIWYGSETFGTGASDHGTVSGSNITGWATDTTVNVETANWYAVVNSPFNTYDWRDNKAWSTTATLLPPGDITEFGFIAYNDSNNQVFAMDNFRVTTQNETAASNGTGGGDWNAPATWNPAAVPTQFTQVSVGGTDAVAITTAVTTAPADCFNLTVGSTGSVSVTGQILNISSPSTSALSITTGGTLALDATSTLKIPRPNTSATLAGVTFVSGSTLNITDELTVDSIKDLSVPTLTTPKVTLASGGTLTNNKIWSVASLNVAGGALDLGGNNLTVTNTLTMNGSLDMTDAALGNLTVNGATVRLNSGTLTLDTAATPDVLVYAGGALAGTGSVIPNVRYEVSNTSVSSNLLNGSGSTALTATGGVSVLAGTNSYTGVTTVSSGATLEVSNLQNAGTASNLGAYATSGPAGIVLSGGTLKYTGASMGTAIDRGITLTANSTVNLPITGDLRLNSLALTVATADLNVTGSGAGTSRLYIDSVTVPTSTTRRTGPVFKPTTANLTIGSVTGNGTMSLRGSSNNNIITGQINLGRGYFDQTGDNGYGQIWGPTDGGSKWTIMGENTFDNSWYPAGGTLTIMSPGVMEGTQNASYAFGRVANATVNWPGGTDKLSKLYNGNAVVELLNDLSTSYQYYPAEGSNPAKRVSVRAYNATFTVGPQTAGITGKTHNLGNLWIHDNNTSVTVNAVSGSGYGLTFDNVYFRDGGANYAMTIANNTTLTLASAIKTAGANTLTAKFDGSGTTTVTGAVSQTTGTFNVTQQGAGTLILNGGGSYLGTTQVTNGKLFVNGDQTAATGNVTVSGGKTLGGTGTIGGNVTINDTAHLAFNLITPGASHDKLDLAATKTMTFSGGSVLDITGNDVLAAPGGAYTLVYAPGGISGSVPTIGTLPAGWTSASVSFVDGNKLVLTVTVPGGDPYATWATGSEPFDGDANGDGVKDGLAWILGALNPAANALDKLPTVGTPTGFLTLDFDRVNPYAPAKLYVEYGSDLAGWTKLEIPATSGTIGGDIEVVVTSGTPDQVLVKIPTATHASGGKLFARLSAEK
jgi:fibronectin-binding autotransporter adhesin